MAKQIINTGVSANDKSGDPIRTAATKINNNFNELYTYLGNGSELTVAAVARTGSYNSLVDRPNMALYALKTESFAGDYNDLRNKPTSWDWNYITGKPDLTQFQTKSEAFSGNYSDLTNKPTLFSGSYIDLTNKPTIPTDVSDLTDTEHLLGQGGTAFDFGTFASPASTSVDFGTF